MHYIKDGVYPYNFYQLRQDNPQTSFPSVISEQLAAEFGMYPVKLVDAPKYDAITQNLIEGLPVKLNNEWVQNWIISDATDEEISQRRQAIVQERAEAYRNESDPLFFKYQRDEIDKQVWLDKVAEIKARYS